MFSEGCGFPAVGTPGTCLSEAAVTQGLGVAPRAQTQSDAEGQLRSDKRKAQTPEC